jgi:transposase
MLGKEDFMVIHALVRRGVYLCDIARQHGVHPKTVSRALARGAAPTPIHKKRTSLLDPYRAQIDQLLAQGVWNGVVILRELQTRGFAGEISIVRDHIRPKRALRPGRATVRFETAPGHQLQGDWGTQRTVVAGREVDVHFVVHTLGYSRRFHFWNTDREDAEHTYEGLIRACEWFGGVAAEVLVDNQKSAVLEHRADGVRFNARFLDLAGHYGFTPRACRPARARTKDYASHCTSFVRFDVIL